MSENQLDIQYLSGKVQGDMVFDTVKAGDVSVKHQIVGVASTVDIVLLDDVVWDGILGLAFPNPALSDKGVTPFFDNVISQQALTNKGLKNVFAYYIDDEKGSVNFGGVDCGLHSRITESSSDASPTDNSGTTSTVSVSDITLPTEPVMAADGAGVAVLLEPSSSSPFSSSQYAPLSLLEQTSRHHRSYDRERELAYEYSESQACLSSFLFVPVSEETYWTIKLNDVKVQYPGKEMVSGFCPANDGCTAIVDTGTYLLYGPQDQVQRMLTSDINGCDHAQMPTIYFDFHTTGSQPVILTLRPIDYILKFDNAGADECVLGVSPDKDVIWTLGQVFLRSFYTVFDRDSNQIGFSRIRRDDFQAIRQK